MSPVRIASATLSAEIAPLGAELQALRDADGRDLLWDGDPAWWNGRSPILFPIVGTVAGGVIRVDGQIYELPRHGFARRRTWALVSAGASEAVFRLEDDAETRAVYPFAFRLDLRYAIEGPSLTVQATLTNTGPGELPASLGYHPAFRWPLPYGAAKDEHRLTFAVPEPAPVRRLGTDGLIRPEPEQTPVTGDTLVPEARLFEDDALIFDDIASRALSFGPATGPRLDIAFPDMPELGIWQKPGAPFLCIEPWAGFSDPEGFAGELRDKPGISLLAPGTTRDFTMIVTLDA